MRKKDKISYSNDKRITLALTLGIIISKQLSEVKTYKLKRFLGKRNTTENFLVSELG